MVVLGFRCWARAAFLQQAGATLPCGAGRSLQRPLLLQSPGSRSMGVSSCGAWAQCLQLTSARVQPQELWNVGLVVPCHLESSQN